MHSNRRAVELVSVGTDLHSLFGHKRNVPHDRHTELPNDVFRFPKRAVGHFDEVGNAEPSHRTHQSPHPQESLHNRRNLDPGSSTLQHQCCDTTHTRIHVHFTDGLRRVVEQCPEAIDIGFLVLVFDFLKHQLSGECVVIRGKYLNLLLLPFNNLQLLLD